MCFLQSNAIVGKVKQSREAWSAECLTVELIN